MIWETEGSVRGGGKHALFHPPLISESFLGLFLEFVLWGHGPLYILSVCWASRDVLVFGGGEWGVDGAIFLLYMGDSLRF